MAGVMSATAFFFPNTKTFMAGTNPAMARKTVNDERLLSQPGLAQCRLTVSICWLAASASAASRLSASRIGVPSAACSTNTR
jgi:hypothetical protein